jgi:hypothetical protein
VNTHSSVKADMMNSRAPNMPAAATAGQQQHESATPRRALAGQVMQLCRFASDFKLTRHCSCCTLCMLTHFLHADTAGPPRLLALATGVFSGPGS